MHRLHVLFLWHAPGTHTNKINAIILFLQNAVHLAHFVMCIIYQFNNLSTNVYKCV